MRAPVRYAKAVASIVAVGGAAACVDLFHSTDFATLCTVDAAACTPDDDGGGSIRRDRDVLDEPDAAPESIDFCTYTTEEARAHAERACAWMGACLGPTEESSFAACMIRALAAYSCDFNPVLRPRGATTQLWKCLAEVSSCDEVNHCLFDDRTPMCTPSGGGTFTGCSTDTERSGVVECGDHVSPLSIQACALEGRRCAKVDESKAICAGTKGAACTGPPRCDGTFAVQCKDGSLKADLGVDCASVGASACASDADGIGCVPSDGADSCTETTKIRCNDETAFSCVGGKRVAIHCGALGLKCINIAPSYLPTTACVGASLCTNTVDECSGGRLRSCSQQTTFTLDCASVGLGPCVVPDGSTTFARCQAQ